MMVRVKWVLMFVCCFIFYEAGAQFGKVYIGVNGLTCSQCTRNVEMRLRRLNFIADVQMNLQHTDGVIRLKETASLDPAAIAKAVKDAGFSLRFLKADLNNTNLIPKGQSCFSIKDKNYQLVPSGNSLQGPSTLQFIGPDFLPSGEYKKWRNGLVQQCNTASGPAYFVTSVKSAG